MLDDHLILAYNDMLAVRMLCALRQVQRSLKETMVSGPVPGEDRARRSSCIADENSSEG